MSNLMGIRHGSVVERQSSELHTNLVRAHASSALKYFQSGGLINLSICMWSGCRWADQVVSQAYRGMPRYVGDYSGLRFS